MPKLGVVVLNFDCAITTVDCCNQLMARARDYSIFVVDNGSSPDDAHDLERFCDAQRVRLIRAEVNGGYSAGNNLGIAAAMESGCDYILIVNPDVLIDAEDLDRMMAALERDADALFCGPKIIDGVGRVDMHAQRFRPHDLKAIYLLKYPLSRWFRGFSRKYFNSGRDFDEVTYCATTSGCCALFRSEFFEEFGPLDEDFFLYSEEVIWASNIARSYEGRLRCLYVGTASAVHNHPKRYAHLSPSTVLHRMRSDLLFSMKYLGCPWAYVAPLAVYYAAAYIAYSLVNPAFRTHAKEFIGELRATRRRYRANGGSRS